MKNATNDCEMLILADEHILARYNKKRTKYFRVRMKHAGEIEVTVPIGASREDTQAFVTRCSSFILKEQKRLEELNRMLYIPECQSFQRIWLFGILYEIRFTDDVKKDLTISGGIVYFDEKRTDMHQAIQDLRKMLLPKLCAAFARRAERFQAMTGRTPSLLKMRLYHSRWGSCATRTRVITLNECLVHAPWEAITTCMDHELCHLAYANHGAGFHRLLAQVHPGYKEAQHILDQYVFVLDL